MASVTAPRAERPELVSRFRGAGLTQRQTADTLGVGQATVSRLDKTDNSGTGRPPLIQTDNTDDDIVDAEIVDEPEPTYTPRETSKGADAPFTDDDIVGARTGGRWAARRGALVGRVIP